MLAIAADSDEPLASSLFSLRFAFERPILTAISAPCVSVPNVCVYQMDGKIDLYCGILLNSPHDKVYNSHNNKRKLETTIKCVKKIYSVLQQDESLCVETDMTLIAKISNRTKCERTLIIWSLVYRALTTCRVRCSHCSPPLDYGQYSRDWSIKYRSHPGD